MTADDLPTASRRPSPAEIAHRARAVAVGDANSARILDAARAAHGRGEPPTPADLAGLVGLSAYSVRRHIRRLRRDGRWPWGVRRGVLAGPGEDPAREARARELVSDPAHQAVFRDVVRGLSRRTPRLADEIESGAWLAFWEAALRYDPGRGSMDFGGYLKIRLRHSAADVARQWGGRRDTGVRAAPLSIDARVGDGRWSRECQDDDRHGNSLAESIPSGEPPVGWAAESEDAVEGLIAGLPERARSLFRTLYLECGGTLLRAARRHGISESRMSQVHGEAVGLIRARMERGVTV